MDLIYQNVAGLDVHKSEIQACVRCVGAGGKIKQQVRTFATMTRNLLALADWLATNGVTHVAMESTGVYWKPIYNLLEGRFEILLVNAKHVKHVPGRKTDVKDCQWLAQLLQCGLLKPSFIPDLPQRELRDLTRHRAQLTTQHTAVANRIHKILEDANIKLASVASNILGVSGRDMLRALINGEESAERVADLARCKLRGKIPKLQQALEGRVTRHHRFMLAELMDQLQDLERRIERFNQQIEEHSLPFEQAVHAVAQLPGFDLVSATSVIAEIGPDMDQFPSARHLASWAGLCPGSHESAGKRKSGKTTKGSRWLRRAMSQSAWGAARTKNSYFKALYHRLVGRRGKKRAIVAVAHALLVTIYHVLKDQVPYQDLGSDYFDKINAKHLVRHHLKRLEKLGFEVNLTPLDAVA